MRDSSTAPLAEVVALQRRVTLGSGAGGAEEMQDPALAAVVSAAPQHLQDAQPGAISAEEAQQQPPTAGRHRLVPQSTLLPQASPGYRHTHAPLPAAQSLQPSCTAKAEQQTPLLHEPEAHAASKVHEAPGATKLVRVGVAVEVGVEVSEGVAERGGVADFEGVPVAEREGVGVSEGVNVAEVEGVPVGVEAGVKEPLAAGAMQLSSVA